MFEDPKERVRWVYEAGGDPEELPFRYDKWATLYDQDLEQSFGYTLPTRAGKLLGEYCSDLDIKILDAGAGTGLMGQILAREGFRDIVGIDLSDGMLPQARQKKVYREVLRQVLGEPLEFPSDYFDLIVCIGTFTEGHAPSSALEELLRVTRSAGHILLSVRSDVYDEYGFREQQDILVQQGKWRLLAKTEDFQALPNGEPDVFARIYVYRVL